MRYSIGTHTYIGDINISDPHDMLRCCELYTWNHDDVTSNLKIGIVVGETDTKVKVAKWTYFCPDECDTNCEFAYTAYTNKEPCNVIILNTDGLNIE